MMRYMNEAQIALDKSDGSDARVPPDRRAQLERLQQEREEDLKTLPAKSARFRREQAKSRKLVAARRDVDALLESGALEVPAAAPPPETEGRREHKAHVVRPSEKEQAEFDKLAAEAQRAARQVKEEADARVTTATGDGGDGASHGTKPTRVFQIGFDYARQDDVADALTETRAGKAPATSSSSAAPPVQCEAHQAPSTTFVRQPTVTHIPEKAGRSKPRSAAAAALAAELEGLEAPAKPKPTSNMARQKSVSVLVDGPRVSASELSKPAAPLPRAAWLVEGAGGADRATFERWVRGGMDGDFLMRASGSTTGYVLCVNDHGTPVNYPITPFTERTDDDGGSKTLYEFMGLEFDTLEDAVTHARATPLKSRTLPGERLPLGFPAIREPWYSPSANRSKVEAAVASAGHASFAVRKSSSGDKYVLVVNDCGDVCSYSITRSGNKWAFGDSAHSSVERVIEHVKKAPFLSKNTPKLTLGLSALEDAQC